MAFRSPPSRFLVLAALSPCLLGNTPPQAVSDESALKAAYLYNFTKFVEWPEARHTSSTSDIVIGVIASEQVFDATTESLKGKKTGSRSVVTKRLNWNSDLSGVHILYVDKTPTEAEKALSSLKSQPVLVVSNSTSTLRKHGDIAFVNRNSRIMFAASSDIQRRKGIKVSSQLLSLAVPP